MAGCDVPEMTVVRCPICRKRSWQYRTQTEFDCPHCGKKLAMPGDVKVAELIRRQADPPDGGGARGI